MDNIVKLIKKVNSNLNSTEILEECLQEAKDIIGNKDDPIGLLKLIEQSLAFSKINHKFN